MGDLTKNLSRSEFACDCGCGFDTVDFVLVERLQDLVDHYEAVDGRQVRITITGGNRCEKQNKKTPGAGLKSQHIYGRAADFKLFYRDTGEQIDPERVADFIRQAWPEMSVGRYGNRTHTDTRTGGPALWRA